MAKKPRSIDRQPSEAVDVMLALAGEVGWQRVSLAAIAGRAGLSLSELHQRYPGKGAILREFLDDLDRALLEGELPAADESPRDHLFDVMMRRFEAMQRHKAGIRAIARDAAGDPWMWLCAAPRVIKTAGLTLEAAGISAWGPFGRMKARAVAAIYAATFRAWLADDSEDLAKTMAFLDRTLHRAEDAMLFLCRGRRPAPSAGNEVGTQSA